MIVDVAAGQLIDIQFADGGRLPCIPQSEPCAGARQTAGLAIATLLPLR